MVQGFGDIELPDCYVQFLVLNTLYVFGDSNFILPMYQRWETLLLKAVGQFDGCICTKDTPNGYKKLTPPLLFPFNHFQQILMKSNSRAVEIRFLRYFHILHRISQNALQNSLIRRTRASKPGRAFGKRAWTYTAARGEPVSPRDVFPVSLKVSEWDFVWDSKPFGLTRAYLVGINLQISYVAHFPRKQPASSWSPRQKKTSSCSAEGHPNHLFLHMVFEIAEIKPRA